MEYRNGSFKESGNFNPGLFCRRSLRKLAEMRNSFSSWIFRQPSRYSLLPRLLPARIPFSTRKGILFLQRGRERGAKPSLDTFGTIIACYVVGDREKPMIAQPYSQAKRKTAAEFYP